jgi:hypothetical protein
VPQVLDVLVVQASRTAVMFPASFVRVPVLEALSWATMYW